MANIELLIIQIAVIFVVAKLAGEVCERLGQPSLVGEILAGVIIANTFMFGYLNLNDEVSMNVIELFAQLGVIFLIFTVGLEVSATEIRKVGMCAFLVALSGVIIPFFMGFSLILFWRGPLPEALFVGAALVATSLAISARVLHETDALKGREAIIILSAAAIDDVLGILVLTTVVGLSGGQFSIPDILFTMCIASAFVVFFLFYGGKIIAKLTSEQSRISIVKRMRGHDAPLILALIFCLGMSLVAEYLRLAAIIGAFFAGMAFADVKDKFDLGYRFRTLTSLMAPFFFVFLGLHVVAVGATPWILFTIILVIVAILSKWIGCSIPVAPSMGKKSAWIVGVAMVPRGEVALIVALIGLNSGIISQDIFASVVFMAIATSIIAPTILKRMIIKKYPDLSDQAKSKKNR
jgi:Kef-type K+ transport system membrane component KefB